MVYILSQRNSQHFVEPKGSLPCSQEPSNGLYSEPDQSIHTMHPVSLKHILILSTHVRLGLPSGLLPSGFPHLQAFIFSPSVLHALPITSSSISFKSYLAKSTSYEIPCYALFSALLLLHPSWVQIFPSAPCSQTTLVYVPPLMSQTKFLTNTESQAK
jgi:hypothetical protein